MKVGLVARLVFLVQHFVIDQFSIVVLMTQSPDQREISHEIRLCWHLHVLWKTQKKNTRNSFAADTTHRIPRAQMSFDCQRECGMLCLRLKFVSRKTIRFDNRKLRDAENVDCRRFQTKFQHKNFRQSVLLASFEQHSAQIWFHSTFGLSGWFFPRMQYLTSACFHQNSMECTRKTFESDRILWHDYEFTNNIN